LAFAFSFSAAIKKFDFLTFFATDSVPLALAAARAMARGIGVVLGFRVAVLGATVWLGEVGAATVTCCCATLLAFVGFCAGAEVWSVGTATRLATGPTGGTKGDNNGAGNTFEAAFLKTVRLTSGSVLP
jgi:hypothetical protein